MGTTLACTELSGTESEADSELGTSVGERSAASSEQCSCCVTAEGESGGDENAEPDGKSGTESASEDLWTATERRDQSE